VSPELRHHLLRSPALRKAARKELVHFAVSLVVLIVVSAGFRLLRDQPFNTDFWLILLNGLLLFGLMWLVQVIRTARQVLRNHSLL
jgi:F0F1-type ATP synthase assembly protein I